MKRITYKLRQKNEFTWHIKDGRKIVAKIIQANGGWGTACQIWDTLPEAVEAQRESLQSMCEAFGRTAYQVRIEWPKPDTVGEILTLREIVSRFHASRICPAADKLGGLFDGRARAYLATMASLGQIIVESNGEISD
jgi:hypothetical protein